MKSGGQSLGSWGEQAAAAYLEQRGYQILERNVRTKYGEIDIIAYQPPGEASDESDGSNRFPVVVFVEVKTRQTRSLGPPEISVNARKKQHMQASIQAYMQCHPDLPGSWRIDVIAIQRSRSEATPEPEAVPEITHFENAFS